MPQQTYRAAQHDDTGRGVGEGRPALAPGATGSASRATTATTGRTGVSPRAAGGAHAWLTGVQLPVARTSAAAVRSRTQMSCHRDQSSM